MGLAFFVVPYNNITYIHTTDAKVSIEIERATKLN